MRSDRDKQSMKEFKQFIDKDCNPLGFMLYKHIQDVRKESGKTLFNVMNPILKEGHNYDYPFLPDNLVGVHSFFQSYSAYINKVKEIWFKHQIDYDIRSNIIRSALYGILYNLCSDLFWHNDLYKDSYQDT